jgi:hypothetical protein
LGVRNRRRKAYTVLFVITVFLLLSSGLSFAVDFTVTPLAPVRPGTVSQTGTGGSISPDTPQTVAEGSTTSFTVTPDPGFYIYSVTGCGGTLSGNTYTTGPITADCTVSASFAVPLDEAVDTESTSLIWTTGGSADWVGVNTPTHDGIDAAESGDVD